jgi:peroxiredoxin
LIVTFGFSLVSTNCSSDSTDSRDSDPAIEEQLQAGTDDTRTEESGGGSSNDGPSTGPSSQPASGGPDVGTMTSVDGESLPRGQAGLALGGRYDAPDFTWKNSNGKVSSLSDYRGTVVLLNFWATWCGPCKRELPDIVDLRSELKDKGFEVIGVSVGERPPAGMSETDVLSEFATHYNLTYPIVLSDPEVQEKYGGLSGVPTSFVIDRDGKVTSVMVGMRSKDEFRAEIEPVL